MMEEAGLKLKQVRERLGLTYRDVEDLSAQIVKARANDEFAVPLSRLADIENRGTLPSIYRLYSLCAIYRLDLTEVLSWFGVSIGNLPADSSLIRLSMTHKVGFRHDEGEIQIPVVMDPGLDPAKTQFLSRFIQAWGKIPLMMLNQVELKNLSYGLIGSEDWSMFPILMPGSLVVVDQNRRRVANSGWRSEFERPIYFIEHRGGYACGWCTLRDDRLILQHHPSSLQDPEAYEFPREAEVIGQVVSVAMSLEPSIRRRPRD